MRNPPRHIREYEARLAQQADRQKIRVLERLVSDREKRTVECPEMGVSFTLPFINSSEELHARMKGGMHHKQFEIYIDKLDNVTVVMKTPGLYPLRQRMLKQGWRKVSCPDVHVIKGW